MTYSPRDPRPNTRKPRPHTWMYQDPVEHQMHTSFLRARSQAGYRFEPWELTIEQFMDIWRDHWHQRGKASQDLCMTRIDPELSWNINNVELLTRRQQVWRVSQYRKPRGPNKVKQPKIKVPK